MGEEGRISLAAKRAVGVTTMNYKRKGHRGRHKKNAMDNNNGRVVGNSASFRCQNHPKYAHVAKSVRNRSEDE